MNMEAQKRLAFYDISDARAKSAKTFDGRTYSLKGGIAVDNGTGDIKSVADIYYDVRSVMDQSHTIVAKRRKREEELTEVIQKSS